MERKKAVGFAGAGDFVDGAAAEGEDFLARPKEKAIFGLLLLLIVLACGDDGDGWGQKFVFEKRDQDSCNRCVAVKVDARWKVVPIL